eukprot:CAMPEP_0197543974 /NCGR_PEP_ID=MMETSP1318-20131121/68525_1 /TAXON_ID=552666 /ORGANISM="Partenskyella glossopodia, Strain RCC365" /LENGTH=134 /DNA_ID=CAMNT_0043103343 /DNA_START=577 /DNA_END=981 /DNA_ORIENTATION=+
MKDVPAFVRNAVALVPVLAGEEASKVVKYSLHLLSLDHNTRQWALQASHAPHPSRCTIIPPERFECAIIRISSCNLNCMVKKRFNFVVGSWFFRPYFHSPIHLRPVVGSDRRADFFDVDVDIRSLPFDFVCTGA